MREPEPVASSPAAALVWAQRGTRDARPLQSLQPVTPLGEVRCKLSVSSQQPCSQQLSVSSQQPCTALAPPTLRSRAAGGAAASRSCTRASSARSGAVSSSATALHHQPPPPGVEPALWAAAVQQAAWESGNARGEEPQQSLCPGVLELQERMLSAVRSYQCEQAALDSMQPRYPRQLQPQRCINPEAVFTASLAAGDHFVTASLSLAPQPQAATEAALPHHRAAAAAQPLHTLAGRLEAACHQVIAGAAQPSLALDAAHTAAAAAASPAPTGRWRLPPSRLRQDSSRLVACGGSSRRAQKQPGSTTGRESSTPTAPQDCKLAAALQAQLPAAAAEAFTAVVEQAVRTHTQGYRERRQEAQERLLQSSGAPVTASSSSSSSSRMTVQQLVALLARQDAAPNADDATALDASAAATAASSSKTAAANERLAAAASVTDLIAAAEQHLQLAGQEFAVKLDLNSIAKAHRLGKTWRASARSGSSTARSVDKLGALAAADSKPSTSRSTGDSGEAAGPVMLPVVPAPAACSTGSRNSADSSSSSSEQRQQPSYRASSTDAEPCAAGSTAQCSSTCGDSGRPPAAAKAQCPVLQDPTDAEMAALPMPSLPTLLDLCHEPGKVLQARLERVWAALATPPEQQMAMVLRHTSRALAGQFEAALAAWECAAASVLQREALLEQLLHLKAAMSAGGGGGDAGGGISLQQVQQVLWAFLAAGRQLEAASAALAEATGQPVLLVGGSEYPQPGAVSCARQLQPMLGEAWALLSAGGHA